jgi:thioredoxin 1
MKVVTDADFELEVLKSQKLTLVDFWASWCMPCSQLAKTLEVLSDQYAGKMDFCKIDVDANEATSARFGIRGLPTVLLFHKGEVVDQSVGNVPLQTLVTLVEKHLS